MIVCTTIKAAIIFAHALAIGISEVGAMRVASSAGQCAEHGDALAEGPWVRKDGFHIRQWNDGQMRYFSASPLFRDDELRNHYLLKREPGTDM